MRLLWISNDNWLLLMPSCHLEWNNVIFSSQYDSIIESAYLMCYLYFSVIWDSIVVQIVVNCSEPQNERDYEIDDFAQ